MTQCVLVIDDDPRICRLIAMGFERRGYTVLEASDGRAGLKLFNAHHPDIVITDILMPVMEGIEAIMEMKKTGRATKIIAISGGGRLVGREFLKWARHLGADEVMAKPFRISALVAAAEQLVGMSEADPAPVDTWPKAAPKPALRPAGESAPAPWDRHQGGLRACLAA